MYNEQTILEMKIKLFITATFFALLSFAFTSTVSAQATPKVTKTQVQQQKRIFHGAKSGELTKAEAIRLQKQQKRVNKHKKAVKADGVVTRRERKMVRKHQKAASHNIYRQKNDAQRR